MPGQREIRTQLLGEGGISHDLPERFIVDLRVALLNEESAQNCPEGCFRAGYPGGIRKFEQTKVLLCRQNAASVGLETRRDDYLEKDPGNLLGGLDIDRPIERDDASEGRHWIRRQGRGKRFRGGVAGRKSARDRVLDDRASRVSQSLRRAQGSVSIEDVVVGQLLALKLR